MTKCSSFKRSKQGREPKMSGQLPNCPLNFEIVLTLRQYMFEVILQTVFGAQFTNGTTHTISEEFNETYIGIETVHGVPCHGWQS